MLSATSSATQVYSPLAPSGIAMAHSVWHRDDLLRVASQSLAVLDFRRLHGSNPHDCSSLKLHFGKGEDFSVKQQSELQKKKPLLFCLRRRSKWENNWGRPSSATDKFTRLSADGPKSGLWRINPRQILSLGPLVLFSSSEDHYCTIVWQKIGSVSHVLQPAAIDKTSTLNAKMYVNHRREDWREKHRTHYVTIIFVKNTGTSTIFERRFQPLSVGGFSSNQPDSISWCPKSQTLKIDKLPKLLL